MILHNLKKVSYNGKRGVILRWLQNEKRYGVQLDDPREQKSFLPANITKDNARSNNQTEKHTFGSKSTPRHMRSKANTPFHNSSSSDDSSDDDDSDEPPPLNDRDQSSSGDSSSSDSVPSLLKRGNRSNSSDSSEDDDSDSSGSIPELREKDSSSSDDEDMVPALTGFTERSSSSSDESDPRPQRRAQRARGQDRNSNGPSPPTEATIKVNAVDKTIEYLASWFPPNPASYWHPPSCYPKHAPVTASHSSAAAAAAPSSDPPRHSPPPSTSAAGCNSSSKP